MNELTTTLRTGHRVGQKAGKKPQAFFAVRGAWGRGRCESFSYNPVSNNWLKMKQSNLLIDNFTLEYAGESPAQRR